MTSWIILRRYLLSDDFTFMFKSILYHNIGLSRYLNARNIVGRGLCDITIVLVLSYMRCNFIFSFIWTKFAVFWKFCNHNYESQIGLSWNWIGISVVDSIALNSRLKQFQTHIKLFRTNLTIVTTKAIYQLNCFRLVCVYALC